MTDWNALAQAGKDIAQAFDYLDRAAEVTLVTTAAILTHVGLVGAAREAVVRANRALGR